MFDWVLYTSLKRLKLSRWPNNRNCYNVLHFMFSLFFGYFFYLFFIALLGCSFFDFWSSSPIEYPVHHYIRYSAILAIINFVTFFVKVIFSFIFFSFLFDFLSSIPADRLFFSYFFWGSRLFTYVYSIRSFTFNSFRLSDSFLNLA